MDGVRRFAKVTLPTMTWLVAACASGGGGVTPDEPAPRGFVPDPGDVIRIEMRVPRVLSVGPGDGSAPTASSGRFESTDSSRVRVAADGHTVVGVSWGLTAVRLITPEAIDSVWVLVRPVGLYSFDGLLSYASSPRLPQRAIRTAEPDFAVYGTIDFTDVEEGVLVDIRRGLTFGRSLWCRRLMSIEEVASGPSDCGPMELLMNGRDINLRVETTGRVEYSYQVRTNECIRWDADRNCIGWDTETRESSTGVQLSGVVPVVR